jgi:hypothetical protein
MVKNNNRWIYGNSGVKVKVQVAVHPRTGHEIPEGE